MTEAAETNRAGGEVPSGLELATFLRLLKRNRVWLAVTILGGMFLAGLASYLVDDTYKARSKVVVEIPKRRENTQIFGEPLTVLGYDSLLNADESFVRVMDALKSLRADAEALRQKGLSVEAIADLPADQISNRIGCSTDSAVFLSSFTATDLRGLLLYVPEDFVDLEFEAFKKGFLSHTSVEKETGVSIIYSPIIDLDATSDMPEKAALLANLWAATFVRHMRKTITEKSGLIVEEILQVYESTQQQLEEKSAEVERYRRNVGLESLRQELEAKQLSLYGVKIQTPAKTDEEGKLKPGGVQVEIESFAEALIPQQTRMEKVIQSDEEQLDLLGGLLSEMEKDGVWVGEVALGGPSATAALQALIASASEHLAQIKADWEKTEAEYSLAQLSRDVRTKQEQRDFTRSRYLDWRARMNATKPDDVRLLDEFEKELLQSSDELISLQARLLQRQIERQRLDGALLRLSHLSARLNLLKVSGRHRGMPAEQLQENWLRQDLGSVEEQLRETRSQLLRSQSELTRETIAGSAERQTALKAQQDFYEAAVKKLQDEKSRIQEKILRASRESLLVAKEIKEASAMFGFYRNQYLRFKNKRDDLVYRLQENRAMERGLREQIRTLREEIGSLSFKIGQSEATLERLESERESIRETLADFSKQVSEARVERERQIADVRVQSRAVPPDRRISPNRRLWVLTVGALVLMFDLAFLLIRRVMEMAPQA